MKNNKPIDYLDKLRTLYGTSDDFRVRTLDAGITVNVVSLDTMCSDDKITEYVIKPLVCLGDVQSAKDVEKKISFGVAVNKCVSFDDAVSKFLNGHTLIICDDGCLSVDTRIETGRSVAEPPTALVMRGPREGFVEDMKVNLTLIRKRLKTTQLKTVNVSAGKFTDTSICVCYLEGIAQQKIVDDIIQRISAIDIDGILDSSFVAVYLDKQKSALFHRVGSTEKPDVAVGKLLEGRVAVIVDGSPMVLTVPYLFIEDLQSPGDYYESASVTSLGRILRFISALVSVLLPALFVCLQKYNYQIIPLKFLITILNATEAIPFSPLTEMLIVIIIFDILREANLRMPTAVGMSLSLVGAIVLGDAAVQAGVLGAPAVMVGALSGIGLYTMPENTLMLSILRLTFTYIGGVAGLFGVVIAMLALIVYMVSLQEYSAPFVAPYAPSVASDKKDAVMQTSVDKMTKRPDSFKNDNKVRRGK
ncbi:MAG: spore germination protein [Corallococcus sp.]|nr:spore germination protein [Corallococcus sp.]